MIRNVRYVQILHGKSISSSARQSRRRRPVSGRAPSARRLSPTSAQTGGGNTQRASSRPIDAASCQLPRNGMRYAAASNAPMRTNTGARIPPTGEAWTMTPTECPSSQARMEKSRNRAAGRRGRRWMRGRRGRALARHPLGLRANNRETARCVARSMCRSYRLVNRGRMQRVSDNLSVEGSLVGARLRLGRARASHCAESEPERTLGDMTTCAGGAGGWWGQADTVVAF